MAAGRRGTLVPLADRARLAGGSRHAEFQQPFHGLGIEQIPFQLFRMFSEKRPERALCNPSIAPNLDPTVRDPALHSAVPDVESLDHLRDRISFLALGASPLGMSPRPPTLRQTAFSLLCSSLAITLTLRCCTDSRRNLTSASVQGVDVEERLACKPSFRARLITASLGNPVNP